MAIVNIREIDNTTASVLTDDDFTVFIPGNIGEYGDAELIGKATLFTDRASFKKSVLGIENDEDITEDKLPIYLESTNEAMYGKYDETSEKYKIKDPGCEIALLLLSWGYNVLYKVVGENARLTTFADVVTCLHSDSFYADLDDKALYNIRFLTNGGYEWLSQQSSQEEMKKATEFILGETYYIKTNEYQGEEEYEVVTNGLDGEPIGPKDFKEFIAVGTPTPEQIEAGGYYIQLDFEGIEADAYVEVTSLIEGISTYYMKNPTYYIKVVSQEESIPESLKKIQTLATARQDCIYFAELDCGLGAKAKIEDAQTMIALAEGLVAFDTATLGAYGTTFGPWCAYDLADDSTETMILPAFVAYLDALSTSVMTNPVWFAAAGALRGRLRGKPIYKWGDKFARVLCRTQGKANNENFGTGVCINAIQEVNPYGFLIYGNRTLFDNTTKGGLVASNFLNIRQLCSSLKKLLYRRAKYYMFEQNNDRLWFNFSTDIISFLDLAKQGQGIEGYALNKLEAGQRATLKAQVKIVPIEAVEKFDLTVFLEDNLESLEVIEG